MRLAGALLAAFLTFATASCADATGSLTGGELLLAPAVDCTQTGPACSTWTYLYGCYFGPTASAHASGCSAQTQCHGSASSTGTSTSGFVCGATQDECYQGMKKSTMMFLPTLVPDGQNNFKATTLYKTLYRDGTDAGSANNNMPVTTFGGPPVMPGFTPAEMTCIGGWVSAGAPNN